MKLADKRKAGAILERGGISQRIIQVATVIAGGTYKEAIENAGRIAELVDAATYDDYWAEKAGIGRSREQGVLSALAKGGIKRELAICQVDPFSREQQAADGRDTAEHAMLSELFRLPSHSETLSARQAGFMKILSCLPQVKHLMGDTVTSEDEALAREAALILEECGTRTENRRSP